MESFGLPLGALATVISRCKEVKALYRDDNAQAEVVKFKHELETLQSDLDRLQKNVQSSQLSPAILDANPARLDHDKLIRYVNDLHDLIHHYQARLQTQQFLNMEQQRATEEWDDLEVQRINRPLTDQVDVQESCIQRLSRSRWITAEADYPDGGKSRNCFRNRNPSVLVFDETNLVLYVKDLSSMRSTLPSRYLSGGS